MTDFKAALDWVNAQGTPDQFAAIRAALELAINPWLPINTAPRDGTTVLTLRNRGIPFAASWLEADEDTSEGWFTFNGQYERVIGCIKGHDPDWHPTHWQPINPPQPEAK